MVDLENLKLYTNSQPAGWSMVGNAHEFANLPPTHQEQILFLNEEGSRYIYDFCHNAYLVTQGFWSPFGKGNFKNVEEFDRFFATTESWQELKKWLYRRGLPFRNWVYVLPNSSSFQPMLMTWKMVIHYSRDLFIGDDVMVFDATLNWCLVYYHDNHIFFGKDNVYDNSEDEAMMQALNERKKRFPLFRHPYL